MGAVQGSEYSIIAILYIRGGILQGKSHFKFKYAPPKLIGQYYNRRHYMPNKISSPHIPECSGSMQEILSKRKTRTVKIIKPAWSNKKKLLEEALTRRYENKASLLPLPDLLMVDGGKDQLNVALSVLKKARNAIQIRTKFIFPVELIQLNSKGETKSFYSFNKYEMKLTDVLCHFIDT